jgi:flagellar biosynthesis protein FlhG
MKNVDVFISYSQKNRAYVESIAKELTDFGLRVWYDTNLHAGDSFVTTINKALQSAKTVLTIWSNESIASDWVIAESLDAFHAGKFSSIRIDECVVPVPFNSSNYLQIRKNESLASQKNGQKLLLSLSKFSGNTSAALIAEVAEPQIKADQRHPESAPAPEFKYFKKPQKLNPEMRIVLVGGSPGSGASNEAIALSGLLSANNKVLLVDGNLNGASLDVLLGLTPETDLASVIGGSVPLETAIFETRGADYKFDILCGRSGSDSMLGVDIDSVYHVFSELFKLLAYDFIIIDGSGCDNRVLRCYQSLADIFIVLLSDEPVSMTRAYSIIKASKRYLPDLPIRLIVNRYLTKAAGKRTASAVQRACKTFLAFSPKLIGLLPNEDEIREINRAQKSVLSFDKNHPYIAGTAAAAVALSSKEKLNTGSKYSTKNSSEKGVKPRNTEPDREPTMEEILDQIRRIIADN